jgi:hypothetical protein
MPTFPSRTLAALVLGAAAGLAQAQAPIKIGFMAELARRAHWARTSTTPS